MMKRNEARKGGKKAKRSEKGELKGVCFTITTVRAEHHESNSGDNEMMVRHSFVSKGK